MELQGERVRSTVPVADMTTLVMKPLATQTLEPNPTKGGRHRLEVLRFGEHYFRQGEAAWSESALGDYRADILFGEVVSSEQLLTDPLLTDLLLADPHLAAMGLFQTVSQTTEGDIRQMGFIIQSRAGSTRLSRRPPLLGSTAGPCWTILAYHWWKYMR